MSRGSRLIFCEILRRRLVPLALALLVVGSAAGRSGSGSIFLAWDPNPEPHVAGYKVHYGTTSGQYTSIIDVGLVTEAELASLEPLRIHYCAVTAYDSEGFESDFSDELPVVYHPSEPSDVEPSLGGGIVLIDPTLGSSSASESLESQSALVGDPFTVDFQAEAGTYHAWARVKYPLGASRLSVSIDDSSAGFFSMPGESESIASFSQTGWTWSLLVNELGNPSTFSIPSGNHTLAIAGASEGLEIDRIALSLNPGFVPTDSIPQTGDAVSITRQPDSSIEAFEGKPLSLEVEVVSTGPVKYQWFKDGYILDGETAPMLSFAAIEPEQAGAYTALISAGQAATATTPAAISIVDTSFTISKLLVGPENRFEFEVLGKLGSLVSVYGSNDLENWSLVSVEYNDSGTISITDPEASEQPKRFYRLEAP